MTRGRAAFLALAAVAALGTGSGGAAARAYVPPPPGRHEVAIPAAPPQTVYPLPDRFLLPGSDSVRVRGRVLVRDQDYFLDSVTGELRLNREPLPGDTLRVVYRALLVPLAAAEGPLVPRRALLQHYAPGDSAGARGRLAADTSFAAREAAGFERPGVRGGPTVAGAGEGASLALTGNKTVAVDFGNNRDVALRQSLDLHATGSIAPGVDVLAVLSDRNTPLAGTGDTKELRELDKLLLEVRGPHAGGALGDVTLAQDVGTFARFSREVTGIDAHGEIGGLAGRATLAGTKGVFVSRQFQGVEGLQGPYVLSDDQGRTAIAIVAGSEVVWLDGVKLTRGESADYSMDYDRGTLTFSARRLISAGSRIAIDYQVALSAYRRNASHLAAAWTRGVFESFAQLYREADARFQPLGADLSDQDRLVLQEAGNDPARALANGVSPGPGDYDAVNDTAGVTHFAFRGTGLGAYSVQFAHVGAGRGAYAESTVVLGRTLYAFVGTGRGDFTPGRQLALPTALSVADGGFSVRPGAWGRLSTEFALSRADSNTFSPLGDGAAQGVAAQASASAEHAVRVSGRGVGVIGADLAFRRYDARFRTPGRIDPAFDQENWGANASRTFAAQDRREGTLRWRPVGRLALAAAYGELRADSAFFARRRTATAALTGTWAGRAELMRVDNRQSALGVTGAGFRDKLDGRLAWAGSPTIRPEVTFDREARVPPAGSNSAATRYGQWDAGVTLPSLAAFSLGVGAGQRKDYDRRAGDWFARTSTNRARVDVTAHASDRVSGALGVEARRQSPDEASAPPALTSTAGYARFTQTFGGHAGQHDFALEWTSEAEEVRLRQVRFVGEGAGAYDSLGNFVGRGDYDVTLVSAGTFERVVKTSGSYHLDLRPGAALRDSSAWGRRLVDARGGVLVQASLNRRGAFELGDLLYTPKRVIGRPDVSAGSYLVRPEVEFGGRSRFLATLLRVERRSTADRAFEQQGMTRDEWTEEARWRTRPSARLQTELDARLGQSEAQQSNVGFASSVRRLRSQSVSLETTLLPSTAWRVGVVGSYDRADLLADLTPPSRVVRVGPHLVYTRGGKWRGEFLAHRAAIGGGALPVLVPAGFPTFPDRWDYTLDLSVRVRERANLVLSANGHDPPGQRFVQSGRVELRAYF